MLSGVRCATSDRSVAARCRSLGGQAVVSRSASFDRTVSHVLVSIEPGAESAQVAPIGPAGRLIVKGLIGTRTDKDSAKRPWIVHVSWLDACECAGKRVDELPHAVVSVVEVGRTLRALRIADVYANDSLALQHHKTAASFSKFSVSRALGNVRAVLVGAHNMAVRSGKKSPSVIFDADNRVRQAGRRIAALCVGLSLSAVTPAGQKPDSRAVGRILRLSLNRPGNGFSATAACRQLWQTLDASSSAVERDNGAEEAARSAFTRSLDGSFADVGMTRHLLQYEGDSFESAGNDEGTTPSIAPLGGAMQRIKELRERRAALLVEQQRARSAVSAAATATVPSRFVGSSFLGDGSPAATSVVGSSFAQQRSASAAARQLVRAQQAEERRLAREKALAARLPQSSVTAAATSGGDSLPILTTVTLHSRRLRKTELDQVATREAAEAARVAKQKNRTNQEKARKERLKSLSAERKRIRNETVVSAARSEKRERKKRLAEAQKQEDEKRLAEKRLKEFRRWEFNLRHEKKQRAAKQEMMRRTPMLLLSQEPRRFGDMPESKSQRKRREKAERAAAAHAAEAHGEAGDYPASAPAKRGHAADEPERTVFISGNFFVDLEHDQRSAAPRPLPDRGRGFAEIPRRGHGGSRGMERGRGRGQNSARGMHGGEQGLPTGRGRARGTAALVTSSAPIGQHMGWSEEVRVKRDRITWMKRMLEYIAEQEPINSAVEKIYDHTRKIWDIPVHIKDTKHANGDSAVFMLVVLRDAEGAQRFASLLSTRAERKKAAEQFCALPQTMRGITDERSRPTDHFYVRLAKACEDPAGAARKRAAREKRRLKEREQAKLALFNAEYGTSAGALLRQFAEESAVELSTAVAEVRDLSATRQAEIDARAAAEAERLASEAAAAAAVIAEEEAQWR